MLYEVKIGFEGENEKGRVVAKREVYVVEAVTFGEAEEKGAACFLKGHVGGYDVLAVKRSDIREVANERGWRDGRAGYVVTLLQGLDDGRMARYKVLLWSDALPGPGDKSLGEYLAGVDPGGNEFEVGGVVKSSIVEYLR